MHKFNLSRTQPRYDWFSRWRWQVRQDRRLSQKLQRLGYRELA